jgi:hypothetical protein
VSSYTCHFPALSATSVCFVPCARHRRLTPSTPIVHPWLRCGPLARRILHLQPSAADVPFAAISGCDYSPHYLVSVSLFTQQVSFRNVTFSSRSLFGRNTISVFCAASLNNQLLQVEISAMMTPKHRKYIISHNRFRDHHLYIKSMEHSPIQNLAVDHLVRKLLLLWNKKVHRRIQKIIHCGV